MTLVHKATCAFHQLPICTCGALNRWLAEQRPKPNAPNPRQAKAA